MSSPESSHDDAVSADQGQHPPTFADLGLDPRVLKALTDVGYESPSPIQAQTIPPLLDGPPRRRPRPDRHRQDRGVRAADPLPARPQPEDAAGAGAGPDPRARAAGLRGVREVRRAPQGRARAAGLRRPGVRRPAQRPAPRRAHRRRHPGPDHGPPREGHARPERAALPGARRGRRDAQDGLRRGRRDDPRRHPGRQARRAVLGDDAVADPPDRRRSTSPTPPRSPSRTRRRPRRTPPSAT